MQRKTPFADKSRGEPAFGRVLEKKKNIYRAVKSITVFILFTGIGYLLSSLVLPFNTRPLGLAALAAAASSVPALLIGSVIGAASGDKTPMIYICTYSALVLMRIFLSLMSDDSARGASRSIPLEREKKHSLFEDKLISRLLTAMVISFVIGIYRLISGGFRYYDLAGVFFSATVTCAAVPLLGFCFDTELVASLKGKNKRIALIVPWAERISKLALAFGLVYAMRPIELGTLSLSAIVAFILTLSFGRSNNAPKAALLGLVMGAASSIAAAPLFMMAGAVASLLYKISPTSAVISACLCGAVWGGYISGTSALTSWLPAMAIGGVIFLTVDRISKTDMGQAFGAQKEKSGGVISESEARASARLCNRDEQLKALSGAFSSLSEMFYNLSDRLRRPSVLDLRRMCDGAFDLFCPGCPDREMCWGLEYSSTLDVLGKLSEHLHTHGRVELDCLPKYLLDRCAHTEDIISQINRSCAKMTEEALKSEKTEVFALDYEGMARILCDTLTSDDEEYSNDSALAESISKYLYECGFGQTTVVCFGGRRKQIIARGMGPLRAAIYSDHLREDIEKLSGYQLVGPTFHNGDDYTPPSMMFTARPKLKAECVCRTVAADEDRILSHSFEGKLSGAFDTDGRDAVSRTQSVGDAPVGDGDLMSTLKKDKDGAYPQTSNCGDTVNVFVSRKDHLYALISDGMGTGENAAFTSELCSVFLEKMLTAGNSVETTLKMLGGLIRSKGAGSCGSECSATVDLLELDLLTAEAVFVKSGAAQSYVIRGGNIYRLMSKTVPIGIIRSIDAEKMKLDAKPGDIIVMVSDGITQGSENCVWLKDLLVSEDTSEAADLDALAEKIIVKSRKAARLMGYEKYDDASVVVVRLADYGD